MNYLKESVGDNPDAANLHASKSPDESPSHDQLKSRLRRRAGPGTTMLPLSESAEEES